MSATKTPPAFACKEWGMRYQFQLVPLSELHVDESYQRSEKSIAQVIGADFNILAFGALMVAKRKSGELYIVDGQQRAVGAHIARYEMVPALVFESSGPKEEATLFRQLNAFRREVTAAEVFRAALIAKVPEAIEIYQIVTKHDFKLPLDRHFKTRGVKWPILQGIKTLQQIYDSGGADWLDKTLAAIKQMWPEENEATYESFILGVYQFLKGTEDLDINRMKEKCAAHSAAAIRRKGEQLQAHHPAKSGFRRQDGVRDALHQFYKQRKKKKDNA